MSSIIDFIINSASYFIMAYFVYSILGRKRTVSIIGLSILLFVELFNFVGAILVGTEIKVLILYFVSAVLPVLLSLYGFLVVTGGLPSFRFKFKATKLKSISTDVQTRYLSTLLSYVSIFGSLVFGILAYFYIDDFTKYIIISVLILAFAFGIYVVVTNGKITSEQVILIIGKNREKIYSYDIPKKKQRVIVSDFFDNPNYIVDPIGIAILQYDDKKIEKHFLYWIATNDKIDMANSGLKEILTLIYKDELERYEKYHYRSLVFSVGKMGKADLVKNKKIK
ncbi:MAG: hypothetical protein ABH890_01165 [Bacillota bacterium]